MSIGRDARVTGTHSETAELAARLPLVESQRHVNTDMPAWISEADKSNARECAIRRIVAEVLDGLRHGYFGFVIECEVAAHHRRRLTFRAGKSYQFLIPIEDCTPPDGPLVDSRNGSDTASQSQRETSSP